MAIELNNTKDLTSRGKIIAVYGEAKSGKTRLAATLPDNLVIGLEPGGLASLQEFDLSCVEPASLDELTEVMQFLMSEEGQKFKNVTIDSASALAEMQLAAAKLATKDGRAAYGDMADAFVSFVEGFRATFPDKNLYMTAKLAQVQDETGRVLFAPKLPGKALALDFPHIVDCFLALRGEGTEYKLQTQTDAAYRAGVRVGRLDQWEEPDLGAVLRKVAGE